MSVLNTYYPVRFEITDLGIYLFGFENTGLDSIEVYEVNADNELTFLRPNKYNIIFNDTNEDFISYGGAVVLKRSKLKSDTVEIYIERNTNIDQTIDLANVTRFPAETIEYVLDKLTMICQEIDNRKCNDPDGTDPVTPITQTINWYAYSRFPAAELNFALDKLTQICLEIDGDKLDLEYLP